MIRRQPHYRREAFVQGLQAAGYQVVEGGLCGPVRAGEVLVIWNRGFDTAAHAAQVESQGGLVIVAENGYLGHCPERRQYYALALDGHNGSGRWHVGEEDRFARLGIEVQPWRSNPDGHIVVFGQRGIGAPAMASPPNWHLDMAAKLQRMTGHDVLISGHPGPPAIDPEVTKKTIAELQGAYCAVVWSSARGVRALVEGIPVLYQAPHWSCAEAAAHDLKAVRVMARFQDDAARSRALHRMSWAQWSVDEIQAGTPFRFLAEHARASSAAGMPA